jgi:hypothetical protein
MHHDTMRPALFIDHSDNATSISPAKTIGGLFTTYWATGREIFSSVKLASGKAILSAMLSLPHRSRQLLAKVLTLSTALPSMMMIALINKGRLHG